MSKKATIVPMLIGAVKILKHMEDEGLSTRDGAGSLAIALTVMTMDNALARELVDAANHDLTKVLGQDWVTYFKGDTGVMN